MVVVIGFKDRIDIVRVDTGTVVYSALPAYVGNATSDALTVTTAPYADVTQLRALIPGYVTGVADQTHRIIWRGASYSIPVPILPRMRRGRVDHYTVAMVRVTA